MTNGGCLDGIVVIISSNLNDFHNYFTAGKSEISNKTAHNVGPHHT